MGLSSLKRRLFPKGVKRGLRRYANMAFRRTSRKRFARSLRALDIAPGSVVCVHSALSALGHVVGGPRMVIDSIRDAVPDATLMMPTFVFTGALAPYAASDPVYDPATTPSATGRLTETLRRMPGTLRSAHPTHPCAALGPQAATLIEGSENAATPFGADSTYGRFADRDDAELLLIHTNSTSIVHPIQERSGMPDLFLDERVALRVRGADGEVRRVEAPIYRAMLPMFILVRGDAPGAVHYLWIADYMIQFPRDRVARLQAHGSPQLVARLLARQEEFVRDGVMRFGRCGSAELCAIKAKPFVERISRDLAAHFADMGDDYALARRERDLAAGLLVKDI